MASGCPCSAEDRSRRVLMVRRLHPAVSMQSLLQTFGAFGSITGCKVFTHKSGRSAGCASLEFANHSTACNAYRELQGAQLNGKAIHLQWFDPTITSPSPSRPGQLAEITGCSPGADTANNNSYMASRSSCSNGFAAAGQQPATPHRKMPPVSPHMAASPFGLLASSPHHNAYAGAAAQQQQQSAAVAAAALLAGGGMQVPRRPPQPPYHQQQQQQQQQQRLQLHRQASAPLSHAYNQPLPSPAGLHVPPSPHMSFGGAGFDALPSPGPGGPSDPGSMAAAAAAAAVANLSAAMAAGVSGGSQDSSSNLAALQLAAMHYQQQQQQHQQIQQQLACLALQQMSGGGSHHDSPLSPARSLHQQQQQTLALAAALHSQQQQQQQMLQHQLSGQLLSPGPTQQQQQQQQQSNVAQLHLARSMPNALGSSVDSSCSSFGSQGQLRNSAMDLMAAGLQQQQQQQQAEHEAQQAAAAAAAGTAGGARTSPFALSQPAAGSGEGSAAAEAADAAAAAASSSNVEVDTVPPSASSLKASKAYHAKKQLFREGEGPDVYDHSFSMLPGSSNHGRGCVSETGAGDAAAGGLPALSARWRVTDDTAAGDTDALAAAYAASSGAAAGTAHLHWPGHDQTLDTISPDLLAALQQMSAELDPCTSPLQHGGNAAGVAALQHQQLLAAVASSQALQQQQQLLGAHFSAPVASADAAYAAASSAGGSTDDWATQMANMHARDVRASDSQVLLGAGGQRGDVMSSFRLSSPSLPGCYNTAAETAAAAAAQAWQHAAMPSNQQQVQQQRSSFSDLAAAAAPAQMPASQAFRDKHKQQLQLQLPDFDLVSAPMTSAQLTANTPFDQRFDQLITTEVMPYTPATAALQSPLNVQAAMLAAASSGPAASSALYGNSSSGDVNGSNWVDWSSMAALLSPMQVPGLATRRFTDCSMPASSDYAGLLMQQEQQHLRQQHSRSAAGNAASMYGRHSSNILGAEPILPGLASLHEQQAAHSAAAGAGTIADCFGSSVAAFGLPSAPARCGDAFGAFGKTRHGSLCLDANPQLLPFSSGQQQQQPGANEAGSASNSSSANARFDSDAANTQASSGGGSSSSNAAMCHLKRGHLSEGGAGVGLYSSGSFTFKPPVLQQLLQESRLGSTGSGSSISGSSSSSEALITEPFQMPSFFRSSQQQSGSSSGGCGGSGGSPTKAAAAAAAVSAPLPHVSESSSLPQPQAQVDTAGAEGCSAGGDQQQAGQLEPSMLQEQQQQQPSFTAPAPCMHPDAAAAAATADAPEGSSSPVNSQQQQQQQQPAGGFEDVYRSLFGGEAVPSSV
uniref:RRM domain-containing protein n=1 Tax=Tetradesmus obliquus TaxID=3088 RepID=A0A383W072_TETOB|eukprot:jgi/Sobl393_1/19769/SZX70046.1